jgi:hypothetical protein
MWAGARVVASGLAAAVGQAGMVGWVPVAVADWEQGMVPESAGSPRNRQVHVAERLVHVVRLEWAQWAVWARAGAKGARTKSISDRPFWSSQTQRACSGPTK